MAIAGISSLGILFGYAVETTKGQKPTAFKQLDRCNNIAGISLETETLDASCLEDLVTRYIAGRQDTGGSWPITFNYTDEVATQLTSMISESTAAIAESKSTWFTIWSPQLTKAFFIKAQVPQVLPVPEISANSVMTIEIGLAIEELVGVDTAIKPTSQTAGA